VEEGLAVLLLVIDALLDSDDVAVAVCVAVELPEAVFVGVSVLDTLLVAVSDGLCMHR
jgi:hypothetical protein